MTLIAHIFTAFMLWWSAHFGHPVPASPQHPIHIVFGGDMMFDRTIRLAAKQHGEDYLFSCLDPILQGADLVVANLEGPITDDASMSVGSAVGSGNNFTFTFAPSTAALLKRHGIGIVNIGNNHIENFGVAGERTTERYLDAAGVRYFGDTVDERVATTAINGVTFALINYNQFATASTPEKTIEEIKAARTLGEVPIVYTHWGIEYQSASPLERTFAHDFIDAGAEIVIGSHPHVIQESEVYRGKHIYYSLGNLIFDQYWNDAVRTGLLVDVSFDSNGVQKISEKHVYLERDRTTCPLN